MQSHVKRLQLYYSPTPNGWKITILLHEAGIPYELVPLNIAAGEQFSPEFQGVSPNGRMPAVRIEMEPSGGDPLRGEPEVITIFESGAIMLYLAELFPEKMRPFCPPQHRKTILEWLFWMNANLGPVAGQVSHFTYYAPRLTEKSYDHSYSLNRYKTEYRRLVKVLNDRLDSTKGFVVSERDYTICDIAIWCWVKPWPLWMGESLQKAGLNHVNRWFEELKARPGLRAGVDVLKAEAKVQQKHRASEDALGDDVAKNLFGSGKSGSSSKL